MIKLAQLVKTRTHDKGTVLARFVRSGPWRSAILALCVRVEHRLDSGSEPEPVPRRQGDLGMGVMFAGDEENSGPAAKGAGPHTARSTR